MARAAGTGLLHLLGGLTAAALRAVPQLEHPGASRAGWGQLQVQKGQRSTVLPVGPAGLGLAGAGCRCGGHNAPWCSQQS